MHPGHKPAPRPAAPPKPPAPAPKEHAPLPRFRVGEAARAEPGAHDLGPALSDQLKAAPLEMDRKAFTRMKRGKLKVDARLDLHGMTLDAAHPRLTSFILGAHARGHRLVLVITGKGKSRDDGGPIPQRTGVLRHQVPQWLRGPALRHAVLQITEAHRRHGGGGAYYVYLRRAR
jgi:DNA-nicking Smr family endonuclease